MAEEKHTRDCIICGSEVAHARWALGYKTCMPCGERAAKQVVRCVVPMHKSNLVLITDVSDLKGINNKGGLVK
jgi:ribosomal protein L37AE/L43A